MYRYEIYDTGTGKYLGRGFMTGLRMLENKGLLTYKDIKRLVRPFHHRLPFPIVHDNEETVSLFTDAGNIKLMKAICDLRRVYDEHETESGIRVKAIEVPEDAFEYEEIVYRDDMQLLVLEEAMNAFRKKIA